MLVLPDRSLEDVYAPGRLIKWVATFEGYAAYDSITDYENLYAIVIDWHGDVCELLIWGKIISVSKMELNMWRLV